MNDAAYALFMLISCFSFIPFSNTENFSNEQKKYIRAIATNLTQEYDSNMQFSTENVLLFEKIWSIIGMDEQSVERRLKSIKLIAIKIFRNQPGSYNIDDDDEIWKSQKNFYEKLIQNNDKLIAYFVQHKNCINEAAENQLILLEKQIQLLGFNLTLRELSRDERRDIFCEILEQFPHEIIAKWHNTKKSLLPDENVSIDDCFAEQSSQTSSTASTTSTTSTTELKKNNCQNCAPLYGASNYDWNKWNATSCKADPKAQPLYDPIYKYFVTEKDNCRAVTVTCDWTKYATMFTDYTTERGNRFCTVFSANTSFTTYCEEGKYTYQEKSSGKIFHDIAYACQPLITTPQHDENLNATTEKSDLSQIPHVTIANTNVIKTCPKGFELLLNSCYVKIDKLMNYSSAVNACRNLDESAHLPIISSKQENDAIAKKFGYFIWVGLTRKENGSNTFIYGNGTEATYQNWYEPYFDNQKQNENCVETISFVSDNGAVDNGKWNDQNCGREINVVCQIDLW